MNNPRVAAWALVALLFASPALAEVEPNCASICGVTGQDTVIPAADSIAASMFADGDWGCASIASNVFSLDASCVTSSNITDLTIVNADIANGTINPSKMARFAPVFVQICAPGTGAVGLCATMTTQDAGPDQVGTGAIVDWDTTEFHYFRLYVQMGQGGATTMDVELECDSTIAFSTPTTMVQITQADLTSANLAKSAWTAFSADECHGDDVFFHVVAVGGNGVESPVIRKIYMGLK